MSQPNTEEGNAEIDLDISGLKLLQLLCDTPLWKKQIHDRFNDDPPTDPRSLQTIGRRVDTLHEHSLLESTVVKDGPDDTRDLYIAFRTTENMHESLR